ncbi:MAG: hypothetical protein LC785_16270 [Acidobacteria bacterium]|nr:hypothetical protein [Acidobacteriota bacterium]
MNNKGRGLLSGALLLAMIGALALPALSLAQDRRERREDRQERREDRREERRGRRWDRYGNYGGSFQLRQTALNAGYNEGIKEGRKDRKRGRTSDYRDSSAYRKATKDYSSKLGSRELYQRYFRDGYERMHPPPATVIFAEKARDVSRGRGALRRLTFSAGTTSTSSARAARPRS